MSDWPIHIVVHGEAVSQGSHVAFTPKHGGKPIVQESNKKTLKPWRANVAAATAEQYDGDALLGPVEVVAVFEVMHNKGHYGTGKNSGLLKDSTPVFKDTAADLSKLWRAVEDSLTGLVYKDDSQVVQLALQKRWGTRNRVDVWVRPMAIQTIGDLVGLGMERPEVPDLEGYVQLTLA